MAQEIAKIVRILSADINGELPIYRALMQIKGVKFMFSNAICKKLQLDKNRKIGSLGSEEIKKLEEAIRNPQLPLWIINRKNDPRTGENKHLTGYDLDFAKREDINLLRKIRACRGIRHESNLPVRGQRTKNSFRKNKTVGVVKKKGGK